MTRRTTPTVKKQTKSRQSMEEIAARVEHIAPDEVRCQHPSAREGETCRNEAIGTFDIPPGYTFKKRHSRAPDLPRPKARLCVGHASAVRSFIAGDNKHANTHEAQCLVCQSPIRSKVEQMWVNWQITAVEAASELGVTLRHWDSHSLYFDLWEKKAERKNTKKALIIAAERGLAKGDHAVKTGLQALSQLAKERGDVQVIKLDVSQQQFAAMTDEQLAEAVAESARLLTEGNR